MTQKYRFHLLKAQEKLNQQEKALSELQNQIEESRKIQENNERRHSAMVKSVTERLGKFSK